MAEQNKNTNDASPNVSEVIKNLLETSPYLKGAYKKAQETGAADYESAASSEGGMSAQTNLMKQLVDMSTKSFPIEGTRIGEGAAIGKFFTGQGYNPDEPKRGQLKGTTAIALMKMLQAQRDAPQKRAERDVSITKGLLDIQGVPKERQLQDIRIQKGLEELFALSPEGRKRAIQVKEDSARATARGARAGATEFSREKLNTMLTGEYFPMVDILPTGEGWKRYTTGAGLGLQGVGGKGEMGAIVQQVGNMNNRMRVELARAAGDVGNLALAEQLAQQKLLVALDDTPQLRELKRATLEDLSISYKSGDSTKVKQVLQNWLKSKEFKENYGQDFGKNLKDNQSRLDTLNRLRAKHPNASKQEILQMELNESK